MKLLFIVNPIAGHGKNSAINSIDTIKRYCEDKGVDFEIVKTSHRGHATTLAREAVESGLAYDAIVSVGGDGTLLEVANGLIGSDISLGILPAGTGNDFYRTVGIPPTIEGALDSILNNKRQLIDVGRLNGTYFANVASIGFDAEVARDTLKLRKFIPGTAAYYIAAICKIFTYKFKDVIVNIDGTKINSKILLVAVANGQYYGGGMRVNPNGLLDDEYLDVIVIGYTPRYKLPVSLIKFIKGTYQDLPFVKTFKCKSISIECADDLIINADGEILKRKPIVFNIKPLSLYIISN